MKYLDTVQMVRGHPGGSSKTGNGRVEIKEAAVMKRNVLCVFCLQDAGLHFLHSELFLSLDLLQNSNSQTVQFRTLLFEFLNWKT